MCHVGHNWSDKTIFEYVNNMTCWEAINQQADTLTFVGLWNVVTDDGASTVKGIVPLSVMSPRPQAFCRVSETVPNFGIKPELFTLSLVCVK